MTPSSQERDATTLLPCPFCGEPPHITKRRDESLFSYGIVEWMTVKCMHCDVLISTCEGMQPHAIAAWNRRAAPAAPAEGTHAALVERVERYLREDEGAADYAVPNEDVRALLAALSRSAPAVARTHYSTEHRENGWTIYEGRTLTSHGYNIATITDEYDALRLVELLNAVPAATPAVSEEDKLVTFFRSPEGDALGRQGDHDNLSPAETAIRAIRSIPSEAPTTESIMHKVRMYRQVTGSEDAASLHFEIEQALASRHAAAPHKESK